MYESDRSSTAGAVERVNSYIMNKEMHSNNEYLY